MAKLKNILLLIIVLGCSTYGGIKGYVYYKVKKQIDDFVVMAAPFALISYDSISSSLQGTVILEDLNFKPKGFSDSIKIDELKFITPNISTLLYGPESAIRGDYPKKMGIVIRGARLNLTSDLTSMMVQTEAETLGYRPANGLACTFSQAFLTERYRELGVDELVLDTRASMERNNNSRSINFKVYYGLSGIEEMDAKFTLEETQGIVPGIISEGQVSPPLKSIAINYRPDAAFNQHTIQYCADLLGLNTDEFIEQLVNQSDEDYMNDLGFVPGPGIRAALKSILTEPGEVRIVALPGESLDLSTLHLYNPKDIPDLLELQVTVKDQPIEDLSFTQPVLSNSTGAGEIASVKLPIINMIRYPSKQESIPEVKPVVTKKLPTKELKYHSVKASELKRKIGREAYIVTTDGKARSGIIENVEKDIVSLQIRMHGGTITTHVPIKKARIIEVQEWVATNK